jgi:hypothetical protein
LSSGSIVLMRGELRGMGREASCDILARRFDDSDPRFLHRSFRYLECSILTAPADLPDGDYIAYFAGHSVMATRTRGFWMSSGVAIRDAVASAFEEGRIMGSAAARPEASADPAPASAKGPASPDPTRAMEPRQSS